MPAVLREWSREALNPEAREAWKIAMFQMVLEKPTRKNA
jgi:hypothetical protein